MGKLVFFFVLGVFYVLIYYDNVVECICICG